MVNEEVSVKRRVIVEITRKKTIGLVVAMLLLPAIAGLRSEEIVTEYAPPIASVVVYPDRALITRSERKTLSPGRHVLRFSGASPEVDPASLRAFCESDGCVVHGISTYLELSARSRNVEVQALEDELRRLTNLKAEQELLAKRIDLDLKHLERYFEHLSNTIGRRSTEGGQPASEGWSAAVRFLRTRSTARRSELQATERKQAELAEEIAVVTNRLNEIKSAANRANRVIEITLETTGGSNVPVSFSYMVSDAKWSVSYGMHLQSDGKIQVDYYGNISQQTGEDWSNVRLSLSTAVPARGAERPRLYPIYVDARIVQTRESYTESFEESRPDSGSGEGAVEPEQEQTGEQSVPERHAIALAFRIPEQATIPTSEDSHRVTIAEYSTDAGSPYYHSAPGVEESAHLAARVKNDRSFPLLAGPVDSFRESGFTGRSSIPFTSSGDHFLVGFGPDRSTDVQRSVRNHREDAGVLASGNVYHTEVEIELKNQSNEARSVSIFERIPVSEVREIKVTIDDETTPGYRETHDGSGILRWDVQLGARETRRIKLHFIVQAPAEAGTIYGR